MIGSFVYSPEIMQTKLVKAKNQPKEEQK